MSMGWELFQHTEEARCRMLEPKLTAERKVSFERDGLDTSKACHISAGANARSRTAGSGTAVPGAGKETPANALSASAKLNACGSNKRSENRFALAHLSDCARCEAGQRNDPTDGRASRFGQPLPLV